MSQASEALAASADSAGVVAKPTYLAPTAERPRTWAHEPPLDEPRSSSRPDPRHVVIHDARVLRANDPALVDLGFTIVAPAPDAFARHIERQAVTPGAAVREAGIRAERS